MDVKAVIKLLFDCIFGLFLRMESIHHNVNPVHGQGDRKP